MESKFVTYLELIGIQETLCETIEKIYKVYEKISPEKISDIFVTEYIKEDGNREYESIWFFSEKYAMEAKYFTSKDDFDITPIHKKIKYVAIKKQDYNFETPKEKSRLSVLFETCYGTEGNLKASKENCTSLKEIFFKYIKPNLE